MAEARPAAGPRVGDRYPQLLRTPRAAWWRSVLGLLIAGSLLVMASVGLAAAAYVLAVASGRSDSSFSDQLSEPGSVIGLLANNLVLALLIPASVVAVLVAHRERAAWLASVTGRPRWRLFLLLLALAFLVVVIFFGLGFLLPGVSAGVEDAPTASTLAALVAVVLLTTPLQAAAEEVGFRGYLTQAIASWFGRPVVGAVVAGVLTAVLFAFAHGIQDAWLFSDRLAFGLVASWLAWRTGGLEAPVALHIANNIVSLLYSSFTGSLEETLLASTLPWDLALLDLAMMVVFAALVEVVLRRRPVAVRREPAAVGDVSVDPPGTPAALSGPGAVGYPGARPSTPPPAGREDPWGMG